MTGHDYTRPEYQQAISAWIRADDFAAGELAVKSKGETYLPRTNPDDQSTAATKRYNAYLQRATFFPVAARTLRSMVGAVFSRDPEIELPAQVGYASSNVDGTGVSVYQQSQRTLSEILLKDRAFLLVDYPPIDGGVSVADRSIYRSTITLYKAESVINWRTDALGRLTQVVIREYADEENGYRIEKKERFRVLEMVDGVYTVSILDKAGAPIVEPSQPRNAAGQVFREIPGVFVGATANDMTIDTAPLSDIVGMNLAHYQIYADWRKVLFLAANPQPWTAGLTEQWRDHLEKSGTLIGSDVNLLLPAGGTFQWAQINANQPLREELDKLQEQMVAVGARLLERGSATMTATQAKAENDAEYSVLSLAASNVSDAYEKCLGYMAQFMGGSGNIAYRLSTDYAEQHLDPQMLQALVAAWQSGTIAKFDARQYLRMAGMIDPSRTDEDIDGEVEADPSPMLTDG